MPRAGAGIPDMPQATHSRVQSCRSAGTSELQPPPQGSLYSSIYLPTSGTAVLEPNENPSAFPDLLLDQVYR